MVVACAIDPAVKDILTAFPFPGNVVEAARYGFGHINDTYCVVCVTSAGESLRYILQGLSTVAFPVPEKVMDNFIGITSHLRRKVVEAGGDPDRETLQLVHTTEGKPYFTDHNGRVWRLMPFVEGTDCWQAATAELFEAAARAFGRFQRLLADYPLGGLHETIENFHNTQVRYQNFINALQADPLGRAVEVQAEIDFILARKMDCSVLMQAVRDGKLPLRVTHNDTKLNNILFDSVTGEGICVIDLDTTMPGLSVNDFGDAIRYGTNRAARSEQDLSKGAFDIELYEVFTRGYLQGTAGALTEWELYYLPWGARLMTLECGIRFLTDYLEGDRYFHTSYPKENLHRCRSQFKLLEDMERQFDRMCEIVRKYV